MLERPTQPESFSAFSRSFLSRARIISLHCCARSSFNQQWRSRSSGDGARARRADRPRQCSWCWSQATASNPCDRTHRTSGASVDRRVLCRHTVQAWGDRVNQCRHRQTHGEEIVTTPTTTAYINLLERLRRGLVLVGMRLAHKLTPAGLDLLESRLRYRSYRVRTHTATSR